ncbi:radical SAM protein [bacterium]|nr:radical SAM protein [bacterium]
MHVPDGNLTVTTSVCSQCRKKIQTRVVVRNNQVFFLKYCPEHGFHETIVANDAVAYLDAFRYHRVASVPLEFNRPSDKGCQGDCGFCPEHEQHVCMPIIEITDHCDMMCPICLVKNKRTWHMTENELNKILDRLIETEGTLDVVNLSGGEPTTHPNFEKMVEICLSRKEILRVSVSTNGMRLSSDESLRKFLAERNVVSSIQFDGTKPQDLTKIRGIDPTSRKLKLIDELSRIDAPSSLTLTLAKGINEPGLEHAIEFLFDRPNILSLMVQPASYLNCAGSLMQKGGDRLFIPDAVRLIAQYSKGRVKESDFSNLPCSHPICFSLSFFLKGTDEGFISIKQFVDLDTYLDIIKNRTLFGTDRENFKKIEDAVYALWSGPSALTPDSKKALGAVKGLLRKVQCADGCFDPSKNLAIAERSIKSIFIHAFMDHLNFDLTRARKCCQVYPLRDGRFMPACVYNVLERK